MRKRFFEVVELAHAFAMALIPGLVVFALCALLAALLR